MAREPYCLPDLPYPLYPCVYFDPAALTVPPRRFRENLTTRSLVAIQGRARLLICETSHRRPEAGPALHEPYQVRDRPWDIRSGLAGIAMRTSANDLRGLEIRRMATAQKRAWSSRQGEVAGQDSRGCAEAAFINGGSKGLLTPKRASACFLGSTEYARRRKTH